MVVLTDELEEALEDLRKDGKIQEIRDFDKGERKFGLTEEGKGYFEGMLKHDEEAQLLTFTMMWNHFYSHIEDPGERLFKIADALKEEPGINILRTLLDNPEKIEGLQLNGDEFSERILGEFDPESNSTPTEGGRDR